ncbi:MAG: hypothetical protein Q8O88_00605 [bacterium]|nr:hypothetical protein [bacterium]
MLVTLEEKEQQLRLEAEIFNKNFIWWSDQVDKTSRAFEKSQKNDFDGSSRKETDDLLNRLKYLSAKVKTEQLIACQLEHKIYKLNLEKELAIEHAGLKKKGYSPRRRNAKMSKTPQKKASKAPKE